MMRASRRHGAFTLIELLVVIAIIAVLASLAIRPLLRARKASKESAALQVLRSLQKAEVQHKTRYGLYGDLDSLVAMATSPVGEGAIEAASEYTFSSAAGVEQYTIVALPPKPDMRAYTLIDTGHIDGE